MCRHTHTEPRASLSTPIYTYSHSPHTHTCKAQTHTQRPTLPLSSRHTLKSTCTCIHKPEPFPLQEQSKQCEQRLVLNHKFTPWCLSPIGSVEGLGGLGVGVGGGRERPGLLLRGRLGACGAAAEQGWSCIIENPVLLLSPR